MGRVLFATSKELRVRTREILEKVGKGERLPDPCRTRASSRVSGGVEQVNAVGVRGYRQAVAHP
ncbi:MAG: hypothetical protein AB1816_21400 [Bacillota bacterium]